MTVTERLLHYVSFDTQSDESSETCPSTAKQKLLGEALVEEMRALGIADARIDADGYVYGSVPGTPGAPAIGLIAHMDTSPDCSGRDIKPRIVEYTGGDIALNDTTALSPEDFPILNRSVGKHLIVTDGARLYYEGLPCPNLFTGGENYHGRFEYVPVEDMEAAVRTLKCILRNAAK